MSRLNSFFCGLPSSKCSKKNSKNKKKTLKNYDNHLTITEKCENSKNSKNNNQTNINEIIDKKSKLFQKHNNICEIDKNCEKNIDKNIKIKYKQNQPFLSRPLKFLSINFLYNNPIGRQLTRENFNNSDICRAIDNTKLMIDYQQAKYVRSIPNALSWRNLLLQGYLVSSKALCQIENFSIRKDDIWLATYPKSGTTWTEEILSLIVTDVNVKKTNKTLLPERVPHLEVGPPIGYMNWLKNRPSPRLMATHLPIEHIPKQLRQSEAKIIYVVRNPKDNAVSYFHHHRMSTFLGNYNDTWSNFAQLFAKGHLVYGDWFEHVRGYWELSRNNPNQVLFISYEELKINLPKMIRIIADFIEHPLTDKQIETIAYQCTFEKMKNNAMVNRENLPVGDLFDMSETKFMRKGIIGDWKNYFTEKENYLFDEAFTERLNEIGLILAYDHEQALELLGDNKKIIIKENQFIRTETITESSGFSESSELSESFE